MLINKTIKSLPLKKYTEFDKSLKNEISMIQDFRTQGKDAYDNSEWESSLKFFQQVLSKQSNDKLSLLYSMIKKQSIYVFFYFFQISKFKNQEKLQY